MDEKSTSLTPLFARLILPRASRGSITQLQKQKIKNQVSKAKALVDTRDEVFSRIACPASEAVAQIGPVVVALEIGRGRPGKSQPPPLTIHRL